MSSVLPALRKPRIFNNSEVMPSCVVGSASSLHHACSKISTLSWMLHTLILGPNSGGHSMTHAASTAERIEIKIVQRIFAYGRETRSTSGSGDQQPGAFRLAKWSRRSATNVFPRVHWLSLAASKSILAAMQTQLFKPRPMDIVIIAGNVRNAARARPSRTGARPLTELAKFPDGDSAAH